jgi:hypothetical protein
MLKTQTSPHVITSDAWRYFDAMYPDKAEEDRYVLIALATDGFNPFGMMAAPYTCWPVFVIPLNLPPGVMFEPRNVFLTLMIPGHPGKNMGVFMQPVWDELQHAWDEGVLTYDRATKRNFTMHDVRRRGPRRRVPRRLVSRRRGVFHRFEEALRARALDAPYPKAAPPPA